MNNVQESLRDSQLFAVASHCKNDGVIFTPFRSNDHSDTCMLLIFKFCEGSLVCVWLPFLAKCSFRCIELHDCVCVLGCAPKSSFNLVISAHPISLP